MNRKNGQKIAISLLLIMIPLTALLSITIGTADITAGDAFRILFAVLKGTAEENYSRGLITIIIKLRIPRILLALLAGASLGTTGTVLQGVFRNPMADPYVMGISSGAALGVTIAIISGFANPLAIQISSFLGAVASLICVLIISGISGNKGNSFIMLLSGIAISFFFTSGMSLLMYLNRDQAEKILFWTFGSLSGASWGKVKQVFVILLAGMAILLSQWKTLNTLTQGDDTARSLGVNPEPARIFLLTISSLITAFCVSVTGIIGFVGLMIPHAMRMLTGSDHKTLIPFSALGGALFLLIADSIGRVILSPSELPVGIVTSLLGTPYLLGIIFFKRRRDR